MAQKKIYDKEYKVQAVKLGREIIYADTSFDNGVYDSWWLGETEWSFTILDKIGIQLTEDNLDNIQDLIDQCITDNRFKDGRDLARAETWENISGSVKCIVDYLIEKQDSLVAK